MSISSATNRVDYTGNGAVDTYSYTFRIFAQGDLLVTVKDTSDVETTLTISTDYTVTGVGSTSGGTVVLVNSGQAWLDGDGDLLSGYTLTIRRVVDLVQETDIRNQGDFYPETHEDAFDYLTMIDQQQQDEISRSVKNPETIPTSTFNPTLPTDIDTASVALVTNSSGNGFEVGPTTSEISNAQTYANNASASATLASEWASKTDGQVASTDYSSKAWAIGGTGVTDTASAGAAKEWAIETASTVDGTSYSAKEHATGTQTRGASGGGSAKDWAQYTGGTVDNSEYSAKYYSQQSSTSATAAAASATLAQNAAASVLWNDVVFITNADSPYTIDNTHRGKLIAVDTSSGAVSITMPTIAGLDLTSAYVVGIKKTTSDGNSITINRSSTDTIDGATSKTISVADSGATFIPDTDPTPDEWTTADFGSSGGNLTIDNFDGDGSTTGFTLSVDPGSENNTFVYVEGVYQQKDTYSVSGTTLTFTTAPPSGTGNIEVSIGTLLSIGTPSDGTVTREKLAAGAVAPRNNSAKTANYTVTTDDDILLGDSSGGAFTFTMPTEASASGRIFTFKKTSSDSTAITINDDAASEITTLNTEGETVKIFTDGTSWFVLDRYIVGNTLLENSTSTYTNFPGSSWQNVESQSLLAGDYLCWGALLLKNNGASTESNCFAAISENSGATTTDHVVGKNVQGMLFSSVNGSEQSIIIPPFPISVAASSTLYLKGNLIVTTNRQYTSYLCVQKI